MLKIWITGSNGQIGTALNELIEPLDIEILNTDKDEIDIANTNEVIRFGEINRPDVIINCAAITDIKECANDKDQAFRVNALGPRNLCIVARKIELKLSKYLQMIYLMVQMINHIMNLIIQILKQFMVVQKKLVRIM